MDRYTSGDLKKIEEEIITFFDNYHLNLDLDDQEHDRITGLMKIVYDNCTETNFFTYYSPLFIYEDFYPKRLNSYLNKFNEIDETDFIYDEQCKLEILGDDLYDLPEGDFKDQILISHENKLEFLGKRKKIVSNHSEKEALNNNDSFSNLKGGNVTIEKDLDVKGLPVLQLADRYFIADEMGLFHKLSTLPIKEGSKNKLLAILMGCSVDNAKKLQAGKYRPLMNMNNHKKDKLRLFIKELEE